MKLRIQGKLLLYILSTSLLIYIVSFGYMSIALNRMAESDAIQYTDAIASKYAAITKGKLESDADIGRTLTNSFIGYIDIPKDIRDSVYFQMMYNVLHANPQFKAIAVSWELSAIDSTYDKPFGRVRNTQYWDGNLIRSKKEFLDLEGDVIGSTYFGIKSNPREIITTPYNFSYTNSKDDEMYMSTIAIPLIKEGKLIALTMLDITLDLFKKMIEEIKPFENSYAFLVANDGTIVAIPDAKFVNQPITKLFNEQNLRYEILDKIAKGNQFSFFRTDKLGKEQYVTFSPLRIGSSTTPWSIGITVPVDVIMETANRHVIISVIVAILGLLILTYVIYLISRAISLPLDRTTSIISDLAKGEIDESKKIEVRTSDEIGDIGHSVNALIDGLNSTTEFARKIGQGNLDADFKLLSSKDVLGTALIEMRKSLKQATLEETKRKDEDKKLNWATQGAAKFAELLRQNNDNMAEFSFSIISNLVKYVGANQGGIFVLNDNKKSNIFLELTASYAFDRRKILDKKITIGVGLVGRCFLEKETIYLTDLPNDYINITSGLGENNPKCLLIVPLQYKEEIYAVVELASFNEFEPYQIQFVEKVGESIASTIAAVKINLRTAQLLDESRIQSEELASQEEEMRQNMEEMQTTQEELERKANEVNNVLEAVKSISLVAEYDMNGRLIDINQPFLNLLGKTREEMVGKYQGSYEFKGQDADNFSRFWNDLRQGMTKRLIQHIYVGNKEFWFQEAYTPIYNNSGVPYKVLNVSVDITESMKRKEKEKTERSEAEFF